MTNTGINGSIRKIANKDRTMDKEFADQYNCRFILYADDIYESELETSSKYFLCNPKWYWF